MIGMLCPPKAQAQGNAQVLLTGIPPTLTSPYLADLERSYQQGLFRTQFIYISPNRQPQSFQFRLSLEHDGDVLIDMTSNPVVYEPGIHTYQTFDDEPAIQFPLAYSDWIGQLSSSVSETGILAEGTYTLRLEAEPTDPDALIPSIPGVAIFTVRYAEPPLLLTPFDGATLNSQFPVFSWTPITGVPPGSMIEYELLIVEVFPGQAPFEALAGNREHLRKALVEQTTSLYTLDELPLEQGKQYAWQVRAQDVLSELPLLDQGETEIYTFTVGAEGLGAMLSSWRYPIHSPFLEYEFENQLRLDPGDKEIYIDGQHSVKLLEIQTTATFHGLLVDVETQRIIEGSIELDDPIALEVSINPLVDVFSDYQAVPPGSDLTLTDGMLLNLGSNAIIDAEGIKPSGTFQAEISYSGLGNNTWTATYSDDFVFSLQPFGISQGRVNFAQESIAKGYADHTGLHLTEESDPVIAQLPDRLILSDPSLGYISLKREGQALVQLQENKDNAFTLSAIPGAPLTLVLPSLQIPLQSQAPAFAASIENVVVDATTGLMVGGTVHAKVQDTSLVYTLDPLGIPIAPTSFIAEVESGASGLEIEGTLTLFGKALKGSDPISLFLTEDRIVQGAIQIDANDASIWLDQHQHIAALKLDAAQGFVRVPLESIEPAVLQIDAEGTIEIPFQQGSPTRSHLEFSYVGEGPVHIHRLETVPPDTQSLLALRETDLLIDKIKAINVQYSNRFGLEFAASVDSRMRTYAGDGFFDIPLHDVELKESGFFIPSQEFHSGIPDFMPHVFTSGTNRFELVGVRIPSTHISDLSSLERSRLLNAAFDFDVRLFELENKSPALTSAPLTVQNASLENGHVVGSILPYSFLANLPQWKVSSGNFIINSITGAFSASDTEQISSYSLTGHYDLGTANTESTSCLTPVFNVHIDQHLQAKGTSPSFSPCNTYEAGSFIVGFEEASLYIDETLASPSSILEGTITKIESPTFSREENASGTISFDLATGEILEADIDVHHLEWSFPNEDPLFRLAITDASLNSEGFSSETDSSFTTYSIGDSDTYDVRIRDRFILGWDPERSNSGYAELIEGSVESQSVNGHFDSEGFHPTTSIEDRSLPEHLLLPGSHGSYITLGGTDSPAVELRANRGRTSLSTKEETTTSLVIPLANSPRGNLEVPVSFDIRVNNSFEYTSGSFDVDYSEAPIDLSEWGYPIRLTSLSYNDQLPLGQRISIHADLVLPDVLRSESDLILPPISITGVLSANGFNSAIDASSSWDIYPEILSIAVENVDLAPSRIEDPHVTISGAFESPIFSSENPTSRLGYTASFQHETQTWSFILNHGSPSSIAIGKSALLLDEAQQPSITTETDLSLTLSGLLAFPPSIGPGFDLNVSIEIGPSGINVWQNGPSDGPRTLFGELFSVQIEGLDLRYVPEHEVITALFDGTLSTKLITTNSSVSSRNDLLPFSGFQFSTDGHISLADEFAVRSASDSTSSRFDLLANQSPVVVLDDQFTIDRLLLSSDSTGMKLDVVGNVTLPDFSTSPSSVTGDSYIDLPVSLRMDSRGRILSQETFWNRAQINSILQNGAGSNPRHLFTYTSAQLDFNVQSPKDSRVFATAHFDLTDLSSPTFFASGDSLSNNNIQATGTIPNRKVLTLGTPMYPRYHPGLILNPGSSAAFFLTDTPSSGAPLFEIEGDLTQIQVTSLSVPSSNEPIINLNGLARLNVDGFSGHFPIEGITVSPRGIVNPGSSAGPAVLSFLDVATFEVGCFDYNDNKLSTGRNLPNAASLANKPSSRSGNTPVTGPLSARLRFGKVCGSSLPVTLTDRWYGGTFNDFSILKGENADITVQVSGVEVPISTLAHLSATLRYVKTAPEPILQLEGVTHFMNAELVSTGSLQSIDQRPSLSLLFNPSPDEFELIPNFASAQLVGGGIFYRPPRSDIDLVSLALNERSNNNFSTNIALSGIERSLYEEEGLNVLLPVDVSLRTGKSTPDFTGVGLYKLSEGWSYLDLDGTFLASPEELTTDLFLIHQSDHGLSAAQKDLQGIAHIGLNFDSIAGGLAKLNFSYDANRSTAQPWHVSGRSQVLITDTIGLPGTIILSPSGILMDLSGTSRLSEGRRIHLDDNINIELWKERADSSMNGYTSFDASIDLIPGFLLSRAPMHGGLLRDKEEYMLYSATNMYADVPFVFYRSHRSLAVTPRRFRLRWRCSKYYIPPHGARCPPDK